MKYKKNHYYNYDELTDLLNYYSETFPDYIKFESIGVTQEQREIWQVTLTNLKTGQPEEKPGFLIDANMHAPEISGTQVCLYAINEFLSNITSNRGYKSLLDKVCIFFVPRVCPDAAEYYLRTNHEIRSSLEKWPAHESVNQFQQKDVNGDHRILMMRKKDSAGAFKISKSNRRLMIQRKHDDMEDLEENNSYYSLYPEGQFDVVGANDNEYFKKNYTAEHGLDLNRQFPSNFRPEGEQIGSGPFPGFVQESKSLMEFICSQTRLFGHLNLHTYGGIVLRAPAGFPEDKISPQDLEVLNHMKKRAAEVSGYYAVNMYKDFRYSERDVNSGTLTDWTFEHRGIYSSAIEIWDVWKAAGLDVKNHIGRYFYTTEEELLKIFSWAKKHFPTNYFYSEWKKFKHPQLGEVEIGGWRKERLFRNPPEKFLEKECEKVFKIIISQLRATPLVTIESKKVKKLSKDTFLLSVVFKNSGFLPTNGSDQAVKTGVIKKPRIKIVLDKNQKIVQGDIHQEVEHLGGRVRFLPWHTPLGFVTRPNTHECRIEWVIKGKGLATVSADFQRGGLHHVSLVLK